MAATPADPNNNTNSSSMSSDNKTDATADPADTGDSTSKEPTSTADPEQRPLESRESRSSRSKSKASSSSGNPSHDGHSKKSSSRSASRSTSRSSSRPSSSKKPSSRRLKSKEKETSHRNLSSNPKHESLSKDVNRQPTPAQLGDINPLRTDREDIGTSCTTNGNGSSDDESLRWSSLQNSPSTAATVSCTSFATQSSRTILVLPSTPSAPATPVGTAGSSATAGASAGTTSVLPTGQQSLLIADPQAMLSQLLQALGEDDSNGNNLADQLSQAMNKLVQTATDNGTLVVTNSNSNDKQNGDKSLSEAGNSASTSSGDVNANRLEKMEQQLEEMYKQQQQLLDFQKQSLQEKQDYQQMVQQQGNTIQQQAELVKQQQQQIQELMQKVEQTQTQLQTLVQQQQEQQLQIEKMGTREQQPHNNNPKDKEELEMLGRLAAFDQFESSMKDADMWNSDTESPQKSQSQSMQQSQSQPNGTKLESFVGSFVVQEAGNPGPSTPTKKQSAILADGESIQTEYVDDDDDDGEYVENKKEYQPSLPTQAEENNESTSGLVEVWTCTSCNFEHEVTALQFCGVCGEKNEGGANTGPPANTDTPASTRPRSRSNSDSEASAQNSSSSLDPPPEPLIQLQLHKELLDTDVESPKDAPPKSPSRRKKMSRSKSTTNVNNTGTTTPRRSRPRMPPRAKTQIDDKLAQNMSLNTTYHGQDMSKASRKSRSRSNSFDANEDGNSSFVVRCLDADGDMPQEFDVDMLNQQLSTFDSTPVAAVGAVPTSAAPKTPKINKRKTFGRSKSSWDMVPDEDTKPSPAFNSKPNLRQAIPRRAKSNSTEQVLMHQSQQQSGGNTVPPSPVTHKKSLFGSAVSAFHKSPKKAISALKMAGHAKSLLMGGKDKDKKHGLLFDSDESDNEADDIKDSSRMDAVAVSERHSAPSTPKTGKSPRRSSLEARASASGISKSTSAGWNKWFSSNTKSPVTRPNKEDEEFEASVVVDIDDTAHGSDDDAEESGRGDDRKMRRRRRGNSSERPSSRGRGPRGREDPNSMPRGSGHGGSNRGSSHGRRDARHRRTQSLESRDKRDRNRPTEQKLRRSGSSSGLDGGAKPTRDWNRRRRASLERRQTGPPRDTAFEKSISQIPDNPTFMVHKDLQEQWEKQDHVEDMKNKAELLKQRVQGLRKGNVEPAVTTPNIESHDDVSDGTEGVSIYLEKSVGDMSEITNVIGY